MRAEFFDGTDSVTLVRLGQRRIPGTPSGRTLRVKNRGIRSSKGVGDLLVTVEVLVPQKLNAKAKEAVELFAEAMADENPRERLAEQARS